MAGRSVSTISIALDAQTAQLKKGFAESRQEISKLSKGLSGSVATGMAKFHAAILGIQAVVGTIRGSISSLLGAMGEIDQVEKFAARIGVSSDQLRILDHAAAQTGASVETMHMALQRMTRRVSEAAKGSGEAVGALQELGLSAEHLAALSPDQQFGAIADAMAGVSNQSDKVRLAMKLFDSEGVALVNTLALGSEGLNKYGKEAEELGILLGDQGSAVEAANDAIDRMKKAWGGLVQQVAIAVAPALEAIASVLAKVVGFFNKLFGAATGTGGGKMESFAASTVKATAALKPMAKEVEKISDTVKSSAERAQEIVDKIKKEHMDQVGAFKEEQGVGAVTRGSQAGFSAVQESQRQRRDAERRHREQMALWSKIYAALGREGLSLVEVDFAV